MTDTLTESFCERCGTKFSFGAPPKPTRLAGLRVLSRGLKNYVLTDDASLDFALTTAREDEGRRQSKHQLETFHETFNFCMSCRQYTCTNCWNAIEGKCLSCAPMPVQEVAPEPIAEVAPERVESPAPAISLPVFPVETAPMPIEATASPEPETRLAWAADLAPVDETLDAGFVDLDARLGPAPTPARSGNGLHASDIDRPKVGRLGSWARRVAASNAAKDAPPATSAEQPRVGPDFETLLARAEEQLDEAERLTATTVSNTDGIDEVAAAETEVERVFTAESESAVELESEPEFAVELESEPEFAVELESEPEFAVELESEPEFAADPEVAYAAEPQVADAPEFAVDSEPVAEALPEPTRAIDLEPEAEFGAEAQFDTEPELAAEPIDAEPEFAPEAEAAVEPEFTAEPEVAAEPEIALEPEPVAALAAEPVIAELEFAAEPGVAEEPVAPPVWWIKAPEPDTTPRIDRVAQPTWPATPYAPVAPVDATPPAAPTQPASPPPNGTPWPTLPLAQALGRVPTTETIWAASSRDVLNRPGSGVRGCGSCGLALSAAARFCRRCGSPQDASPG